MTNKTKNILSTSIIAITITLVSLYAFTPQGRRAGNAFGRAVQRMFSGTSGKGANGEGQDSTEYEFGRPAEELENLDILTLNNADSLSIIGQGLGTTDSIPSYYRNEPLTGFGEGDIGVPPPIDSTALAVTTEQPPADIDAEKAKEEPKKAVEEKKPAAQIKPLATRDIAAHQAQLTELKKKYKSYKDHPNDKLKVQIEAEKETLGRSLNDLVKHYGSLNKPEEVEEASDMLRDLAKLTF